MRIHEELRETDSDAPPAAATLKAAPPVDEVKAAGHGTAARAAAHRTELAAALAARVESLERAVSTAADVPATAARIASGCTRLIAAAVVIAGLALFGFWMQRQVDSQLSEAAARVADAERQSEATSAAARQEAAATREEAARQVADARQSAAHAQIVGNVLAAPDLLRYWLRPADATSRAYAQVLFSRSRGMVFSASRLPAPGEARPTSSGCSRQADPSMPAC